MGRHPPIVSKVAGNGPAIGRLVGLEDTQERRRRLDEPVDQHQFRDPVAEPAAQFDGDSAGMGERDRHHRTGAAGLDDGHGVLDQFIGTERRGRRLRTAVAAPIERKHPPARGAQVREIGEDLPAGAPARKEEQRRPALPRSS